VKKSTRWLLATQHVGCVERTTRDRLWCVLRTLRFFHSLSAKAIFSRSERQQCSGLSLLEVMLALAILGASLAAIGELVRIGARNAEMARDLTTAQLLCESTMAEIQLGFLAMQSVGPIQVTDLQYQQEWLYTITIAPIDQEGLTSVWVQIEQNPEVFSRPVAFAATRWMIDPSVAVLTDESSTMTGGAGG